MPRSTVRRITTAAGLTLEIYPPGTIKGTTPTIPRDMLRRRLGGILDLLATTISPTDENRYAFLQAIEIGRRAADELAAFRKGRSAKRIAWQDEAREIFRQTPAGPSRAARACDRLFKLADKDHEIIHQAILTEADSSCRDIRGGCAKGPHLHVRPQAGSDRLVTVSRKRVLNFLGGRHAT